MEPIQSNTPAPAAGTKFKQSKIPVQLLPPEAMLQLFDYNEDLRETRLGEALEYLLLWYTRSDTSGDACNALETAATLLMADIADELACEPLGAWLEVAKVLEFGAYLKPRPDGTPGPNGNGHGYGERNWEKGMCWGRPFAALMRHMWAWMRGEKVDPETGISHLAHAACNIAFLIAFEERKIGTDDRPT